MTTKTKTIMFLGAGSDVGKSIVAAAFCRILKRRGLTVAPFKAQNMSNNSFITMEGGEIGRAQVVQAEACGLAPSSHMNPVLLKPSSGLGSQVVVQGRVLGDMSAVGYHHYKKRLKTAVMESYDYLAARYDVIVMEGAGSCVEVNLKENDLVNFAMAKEVGAPCIVIADIDRGGVFAQIVGSHVLMTNKEKDLTAGWLINKFRGDRSLFDDGVSFIEQKTRKPVFGVVPYFEDIYIDPEDSVAVQIDKRPVIKPRPDRLNVAVIHFPGISNFTDLEALEREPDVIVNYLSRSASLEDYDLLILPGSKNVMEDSYWTAKNGWSRRIKEFAGLGKPILGLCGGYQILGREIRDPLGVESPRGRVKGLGLLPVVTTLEGDKILRQVTGVDIATGRKVRGYEIHMGRTVPADNASSDLQPFLRIHAPGSRQAWEDGWIHSGRPDTGGLCSRTVGRPGF